MALDREQHVAEAAEHMGADRLALERAGDRPHLRLVGGDAEMVRPEPDEPLDKSDLGRERGVEPRLGFGEVELLRRDADGRTLPRRPLLSRSSAALFARVLGLRVLLLRGFGLCVVLAAGLTAHLALRLAELDRRAQRRAAAHQVRRRDAAGVGAIELGDQRAARIGCDRRDRSGARSQSEPVQRERPVL